MRDLMT